MILICQHCNYKWDYGGVSKHLATCPDCHYKVAIPKSTKKNKVDFVINPKGITDYEEIRTNIKKFITGAENLSKLSSLEKELTERILLDSIIFERINELESRLSAIDGNKKQPAKIITEKYPKIKLENLSF